MKATNAREIVKILLMKEHLSISKLAKILSTDEKKVYQQTISQKLINGTLKFNEMMKICDILGYDIEIVKK